VRVLQVNTTEMATKILQNTIRWAASRAARSYAASSLEDARRICLDLRRDGFGASLCFWNSESDGSSEITSACFQLLDLLETLDAQAYLSIKLPGMRFDEAAVFQVLTEAARRGRCVHFDSHAPEDADRTFQIIESGLRLHPNLSCTIPGRWTRSIVDARLAAEWGLRVRVVKGQWADPADPHMDMSRGFLNVVDELAGRGRFVAIASHDVPLARASLLRLMRAGTPCELELLYGLPWRAPVQMARELGVPVRFYVPQGKAWLPYLLKNARNNPRVLGWFARDLIRGYTA